MNCIECAKCKNKTYNPTPNDIICVSIPETPLSVQVSLYDCLNEMFKVEKISYKCEEASCGNTQNNLMEKKILSKPHTIIIKIKKYNHSSIFKNNLVKNNKMIEYPDILNINKYFCGDDKNEYKLYGIINHSGSLNSGHYYSYVRNINDSNIIIQNQWVCCNDSTINNISIETAMTSQNAYMLFYTLSNN